MTAPSALRRRGAGRARPPAARARPRTGPSRTARSTAVKTVRASANFTSVLAGCTLTSTRWGGTSTKRNASKPRSPPPAER